MPNPLSAKAIPAIMGEMKDFYREVKKVREVQPFKDSNHLGICMILEGSDSEVEIIRK